MTHLIKWIHEKEGEKEYEGYQELADALGVPYPTAWRYVHNGWASDLEVQQKEKPRAVIKDNRYSLETSDKRAYWREAQRASRARRKIGKKNQGG